MKGKVICQNCGWSWNKSESSVKDMHVCHNCGKSDVNMKNGGWLDAYNEEVPQAQNGIEGTMAGLTDKGFNYNGAWGGQFQTGGSMPGAVGFTYARTQGIPSEGPYAKKTMPSAQNGQEMKYYQEGLDWRPKTISQNGSYITGDKVKYDTPEYREAYNRGEVVTDEGVRSPIALDEVVIQNNYRRPRGFWEQYRDKIVEENKDAGPLGAMLGTPVSAVFSLPQLAATKLFSGNWNNDQYRMERPSEAMDIENPYLAIGTDVVLDPTNLMGTGLLTKEKALQKLTNLRNVNAEGKIFNALNNELNNMAIQNTERYMAKRKPSTSTLSPEMEPYVSRYTKLSDEPYIPYQEDEYIKWFNEQKAKMNPPVVKQDPRSILRSSSVIDINDVLNNNFELFDLNNVRKPSGSIGNQGATPEGARDILKSIGIEVESATSGQPTFKEMIEHLKNNPKDAATYKKFLEKEPINVSELPDGSYQINDGHHRATLSYYSGNENIPTIIKNKGEYIKQRDGGIIKDDMGQWNHPGEITEIGSNDITMQGVPYPVLGISDEGDTKLMKPGKNYKFKGKKVTEFPMAKNGINDLDAKPLQKLDNLLNFTNYNKPTGWLDKY
jgi:hypothetical protein